MEQLHIEVKTIENPSDIEEYTNPHAPYVIITQNFDCDVPNVGICKSIEQVLDYYHSFRKSEPTVPIIVEEIINWEDCGADEEILNYVVDQFKGVSDSLPFFDVLMAADCEVEWENLSNEDYSCKFTIDKNGNIDME